MVILRDSEDRFHNLATPGSYEWTYFDGLSDDAEWGFVAIWFRGSPISPFYTAAIDRHLRNPSSPAPRPEEYCAFNLTLYQRGRKIFSIMQELPGEEFGTELGRADARLGKNAVRGETHRTGTKSYLFYIDSHLALGRTKLVGDIEMHAQPQDLGTLGNEYDPASGGDFWVPAALDGRFTARLDLWQFGRSARKLRFTGRAYHDRHFGTTPLHHFQGDWQWGRLHSGPHTFVYLSVTPDDRSLTPFREMLLLDNGRLVRHAAAMELGESSRSRHWTGLTSPKDLSGDDPDAGLRFSASARWSLGGGPFHQRLISDIAVDSDGKRVLAGPGFTEFFRPSRLGVAPFRTLLKFRVRKKR